VWNLNQHVRNPTTQINIKQTLKETGYLVFKEGVISVVDTLKIIIHSTRKTRIKCHTCNYRQFALFVLSRAFRRRLGLFYIDQKDTRNQAQDCVGPNLTREKIEHRFVIPFVRYNVASLTVLQFQSLPNFPKPLVRSRNVRTYFPANHKIWILPSVTGFDEIITLRCTSKPTFRQNQ